jgi:preprotein translocase subunit SecA
LSLGIHEAVEIKENVDVGGGTKQRVLSRTKTFTLYPKLAGMTGTGKQRRKNFKTFIILK